jgi:hypothetical protein
MTPHHSLRFTLLDQQIVDSDQRPVGRVDDLEIDIPGDGGEPEVVAVLTGAQALGERLGGPTGRLMAAVAVRLRTGAAPSRPAAVPAELVTGDDNLVTLTVPIRELSQLAGLERWLADHVVEGLPGAGDARE